MPKPKITNQQVDQIAQVAATMAIENMPLTKQCYQNAADVLSGKKTANQVASEITKKYKKNAI